MTMDAIRRKKSMGRYLESLCRRFGWVHFLSQNIAVSCACAHRWCWCASAFEFSDFVFPHVCGSEIGVFELLIASEL